MATVSPRATASASRAAAAGMSVSASGSGISARTVGSRKVATSSDLDAAPGEDARQQLRHVVVALRDRERARRAALVEPVAPGAAAGRALDAEEEAPRRGCAVWSGRLS